VNLDGPGDLLRIIQCFLASYEFRKAGLRNKHLSRGDEVACVIDILRVSLVVDIARNIIGIFE
jgi:hypothetical protein